MVIFLPSWLQLYFLARKIGKGLRNNSVRPHYILIGRFYHYKLIILHFSPYSQDVLNSSNSTTNNKSFTNNNKSIIEKESTSFNLEDSKFNTPTYSTTLNTQVKNNNNTNGFKEESFLIKTTSDSLKSNGFQVESGT